MKKLSKEKIDMHLAILNFAIELWHFKVRLLNMSNDKLKISKTKIKVDNYISKVECPLCDHFAHDCDECSLTLIDKGCHFKDSPYSKWTQAETKKKQIEAANIMLDALYEASNSISSLRNLK